MPGPSSAMSTRTQPLSASVVSVIVPVLAERADRVVEQVRPDLVELGAAHGQLRQRLVVVALDLDLRVLELVAEHDQRALQALVHVGDDDVAAVHVGVGLDRLDEVAHAVGGLQQLGREPARGQRGRDPLQRLRRRPGRRSRCTRSSQSVSSPAAPSGSDELPGAPGCRGPRARRASRPRRRRRPSRPAARAPRRARAPRAAAPAACRRPRARSRSPRTRRSAWLIDLDGLDQVARRAARRRGRVVELVREPGGHRAERGQPLAAGLARVDAAHHRPDHAHHVAVHRAVREREVDELLARDDRDPARPVGDALTGSGLSVIAAIAPIQVGADVRRAPARCARRRLVARRRCRRTAAAARASARPARAAPRRPRRRAARRPPPTARAPRRSARRTGRPAADRRADVMPPPGTRGPARRPSSPRRRRWRRASSSARARRRRRTRRAPTSRAGTGRA